MIKHLPPIIWRIALTVALIIIILVAFSKGYVFLENNFPVPGVEDSIGGFNDAQIFIDKGYPEIKALGIQFLTLLTTILVFSVTFSEKIVNFSTAKYPVKFILIASWVFLIVAMVYDGIGLAYNAYAFSFAIIDSHIFTTTTKKSLDFYDPAFFAIKMMIMSGGAFLLGIICIVAAGIISVFRDRKPSREIF